MKIKILESKKRLKECAECGDDSHDWTHGKDHEGSMAKSEIKDLITALDAHIQTQYDWHLSKIAEIEACETLSELDAIVIQETTGVI